MDTALVVKANSARQVYKGQGEGDTKWKGCPWKLLLIEGVIFDLSFLFNSYYVLSLIKLT